MLVACDSTLRVGLARRVPVSANTGRDIRRGAYSRRVIRGQNARGTAIVIYENNVRRHASTGDASRASPTLIAHLQLRLGCTLA